MKELRFSVVITTKNRVEFLERALRSIFCSTKLPAEIIVINDGGIVPSLDYTFHNNVEIKLISYSESKGANFCRNQGILKAKHNNVFLLDDDDSVTEKSFESRLAIIPKSNDYGVIFTGINIVFSNDLRKKVRVIRPKSSLDYYESLLTNGNVIGSTSRVLINRSAFIEVGMFDENLMSLQDYELWLRISERFPIYHDNSCGINYTIHDDGVQISSSYKRYVESSEYIKTKYKCIDRRLYNKMVSNLYLRVAISAAHGSSAEKNIYIFKSLKYAINYKALVLLFPYKLLKLVRPFV